MKRFGFWTIFGLSLCFLLNCGDDKNACDDLKPHCESCSESVSRSVCFSFVEADDKDACEEFHQNGLQACAADAGIDTGPALACQSLQGVCDQCDANDVVQNTMKSTCSDLTASNNDSMCQSALDNNSFGPCVD